MNTRNMLLVGSMAVIMACSSAVYAADTPMVAARRGDISVSAPKAPAVTKPATTKGAGTNTTQKATSSNSQKTQPSSQANTGTNRTAANGTSSSRWGSAMRNIGLFAGGMFLGSMLSSLLGWGSMGFLSDILGIFMNIILFLVIIAAIRWLWRKIRGNTTARRDEDAYRRGYEAAMREKERRDSRTIDVTPLNHKDDHT